MNGKTIVVLESNQEVMNVLDQTLKEFYEVHLFSSPPDNFLVLMEEKKPDLIIIDWLIPNVNTEDLIIPLRTACGDNMKIIITSAHKSVHEAFASKPIDAILSKPFGANELKNLVAKLLH